MRYKRGQVDWTRIVSLSLYTRPDQLKDEIGVELGPFRLMTFSESGQVFEKWPERVPASRTSSARLTFLSWWLWWPRDR